MVNVRKNALFGRERKKGVEKRKKRGMGKKGKEKEGKLEEECRLLGENNDG